MTLTLQTAFEQEQARLRALHPTPDDIPGCISLFDDFLACNVARSQIKSLYRYGEMATCTQKLEDFKFCMAYKNLHPEERRNMWIKRRAEWWAHRRVTKSSEDVWDIRDEPKPPIPLSREDLNSLLDVKTVE